MSEALPDLHRPSINEPLHRCLEMDFQYPLDRIPTSRKQYSCHGGVTRIHLVVLDVFSVFLTVMQQKTVA
ncbi:hypothetical protein Hanom_Chr13g01235771 [Helianthus anomalus]